LAVDAALLGIQIKLILTVAPEVAFARSAINMVGQGERSATIKYDILDGSDEAQGGVGGASIGGATSVKSSRSGR
jgi:hypothetical protein